MTNHLDRLLDLAWLQLWQVSLVALIVMALVRAFGRQRPHLAYLLWMLVIVKCLTPPLWSSPTGVFSWLRAETQTVSSHKPDPVASDPLVDTEFNLPHDFAIGPIVPARDDVESAPPSASAATPIALAPQMADKLDPEVPLTHDSSSIVPQDARLAVSWPIVLALCWGMGAAVCTTIVLARQFLCACVVWRYARVAEPELQSTVDRLSRRLGIRRSVRLLISSEPFGPAVYGVFRPTILLPHLLTHDRFAKRLEAILAHELIHFRRGDTLLGALQMAAQIIWWFHPLVWWSSRELTRERERCCDEEAVAGLACDPSNYAQTLLDVLRSKRELKPLFAVPGVRPVEITARRLEHIMQPDRVFHDRTPRSSWLVGGLVAALLLPGGGLVLNLGVAATDRDLDSRDASAVEQDWPQYGGGSRRNNVSNIKNLPTSWDLKTRENIKWTAKLGTSVYSSPVTANGKVLIGSNNGAAYGQRFPRGTDASCLLCFDADTGEFLWQHANAKLKTGRVHDWPLTGICSTSLIEGSRVWYVNNRNEVMCLDLEGFYDDENDGQFQDEPTIALGEADVVWSLDLMKTLGVSQHNQAICSITSVDDLLLVSTSNGVGTNHSDQPPAAPSFIAVKKDSGKLIWQDDSPNGNLLHGQWSSPAYGVIDGIGQAIFAGGDGWLYSFDVTAIKRGKSKLLWKFDCNPKESQWILGEQGTRNNAIAIPVIHDDRVFIAVGQDPEHGEGEGHAWCIDATKRGDISPELVFNESDPNQPISHKRLQAAQPDKGDVVKPNPNSGVVWHFDKFDSNGNGEIEFGEAMHRSFSSVVIHDGLAVIPDFSGLIHCLDAETGKPHWSYDMFATVWGTPLLADGKIYIGDEDGDVAIFELSATLNLIAEINVGNSVYTTIMAARDTLFIPSRGQLLAVQSPTSRSRKADSAAVAQWPSGLFNSANAVVSANTLPPRMDSLWTFRTNSDCEASPVVADGVAYVGDLVDTLYAIDMKTGLPRWTFNNDEGFAASPLLVGERLFIGDLAGTMHCIDARVGRQIWKFDTGSSISGSANALDGLVVCGTEEGTIFAFEPKTGRLAWKTTIATQLQSAPAIDGRRIVIAGCDQQMHVLEVNSGKRLFSKNIASPSGATPALRNGFAFVGTEDGVLFCIQLATGKVQWRFTHKSISTGIREKVAVTDDRVIVAGRGKSVLAIDVESGELLWQFAAKSRFDSSPVIVDGHVMIGSSDGRLYVIDVATGEARLVYETGSSMVGSVAVSDGRFVLATDDGKIICLGDRNAKSEQAAQIETPTPLLEDREFGLFRIESAGSETLRIQSRQNGTSPEVLISGRCRLTFGEGAQAIVAEADNAMVRRWLLGVNDWSKAEFVLQGDVIMKTADSKIRAESIRYDAATRQFECSGSVSVRLPEDKSAEKSKQEKSGVE